MKYAYAALALAALAMADTATILSDIATIKTDTDTLASSLGSGNVGTILNNAQKVNTDLMQGTTDAKALGTVSDADASSVLSAVNGLTPDIKSSIDAAIAAFPPGSGLASAAASTLQSLMSNTDSFGSALVAAAPEDMQCAALNAAYTVDVLFSSALSAYGTQVAITSPTCTEGPASTAAATSSVAASTTAEPTSSSVPTSAAGSSSVASSSAGSSTASSMAGSSSAASHPASTAATSAPAGTAPAGTATHASATTPVAPTSSKAVYTGAANANRAAGFLAAAGLAAAIL